MHRILVIGGPKVGKTTFCNRINTEVVGCPPIFHGDDLIATYEWSEASEEISHWLDKPGDWIIEGVQVVRALRKWLARNPGDRKPADIIYYADQPFVELTKGQEAMAKGHEKIWLEIKAEMTRRGVEIRYW